MGKPGWENPTHLSKIFLERGDTRGSETSQYPEEKKPKGIPLVVASERGGAQTMHQYDAWGCRGEL
jgi:hypothetical protein